MSKSRKRHAQWHNNYIIIIEIVDEKSFRAQTSPSTIIIVWRRYRYDKQSTIIQITGQKRTPDQQLLSPGYNRPLWTHDIIIIVIVNRYRYHDVINITAEHEINPRLFR